MRRAVRNLLILLVAARLRAWAAVHVVGGCTHAGLIITGRMPSRRKALGALAAATALPAAAQHAHGLMQVKTSALPKPRVFHADELKNLAALTDTIIPRTDTPGAADAGVPLLIDELIALNPSRGVAWKACLAYFGNFADASPEARTAAMTKAMREAPNHFSLLKDTTIDLYYRTREGLNAELGWNGATYLPEFKGCTHPEHQS